MSQSRPSRTCSQLRELPSSQHCRPAVDPAAELKPAQRMLLSLSMIAPDADFERDRATSLKGRDLNPMLRCSGILRRMKTLPRTRDRSRQQRALRNDARALGRRWAPRAGRTLHWTISARQNRPRVHNDDDHLQRECLAHLNGQVGALHACRSPRAAYAMVETCTPSLAPQ